MVENLSSRSYSGVMDVAQTDNKPYDTVIIIDSNVDISQLKQTLRSKDVYTAEKGDEGRWESEESVEYISFASILRKPFSLLEHLSADLREARDGCTVGVMWLLNIVNVSICVYICSVLAQASLVKSIPQPVSVSPSLTSLNSSLTGLSDQASDPGSTSVGRRRFPSVVICNNNLLMKSATNEMMEEVITSLYHQNQEYEGIVSNLTLNTLRNVPDFDSVGWLWFYAMSQHKLDTMFVKCTFDGVECTLEDFTPILTDAGLCYTFNAAPEVRELAQITGLSTLTGQRDARINDTLDIGEEGSKLEIWLSVQQEEYMYQRDSNMAGFNVAIQHPDFHHPLIKDKSIVRASLGETELVISMERNPGENMPEKRSEYYMKEIHECIRRSEESICGCVWFYDWLPSLNVSVCDPASTKLCLLVHQTHITSQCHDDVFNNNTTWNYGARYYNVEGYQTYPVSMMKLKSIGDYWSNLNHGDTPYSDSENWKLAMGLPLEPYFYWKENLAIITVKVVPNTERMPRNIHLTEPLTDRHSGCHTLHLNVDDSLLRLYLSVGVFVFCTGLTLINLLKIALALIRRLIMREVLYD